MRNKIVCIRTLMISDNIMQILWIFDFVQYFLKFSNNLPKKILLLKNRAISNTTREFLTIIWICHAISISFVSANLTPQLNAPTDPFELPESIGVVQLVVVRRAVIPNTSQAKQRIKWCDSPENFCIYKPKRNIYIR